MGAQSPAWGLGCVLNVRPETAAVAKAFEQLTTASDATAVLFWDALLGTPDQGLIQDLIASPVDCWHAGLKLGMGSLPGIMDFISPTWMLACDPPPDIEATSWRLSLRACLVRTGVLRKLGGPRPEFQTLEAAALEMGHRWIRRGALMRHVPQLVDHRTTGPQDHETGGAENGGQRSVVSGQLSRGPSLPFVDELRFAYYRHGRKWAGWALFRAVMTRYVSLPCALSSWREVMSWPRPTEPPPLRGSEDRKQKTENRERKSHSEIGDQSSGSGPQFQLSTFNFQLSSARVSVLIPTVDRYPYLRTLLAQLRQQTVPPLEIIIVDQTAGDRRQPGLFAEFGDLPLRVIYHDEPGQCTSRNAGLQMARGDYVLFIDDDDEIQSDLIESHLQTLAEFRAEVSSGVADEVGAGPLPADFCLLRASDVFPTNNTMIRRDVLRRSGLFDLAYNRRQRADGDLGMRIYLAGALMVLNPAISVLHHHAPSGGLRKHKARTVTYAMSRGQVFCRALASVSEFYLAGRYFPRAHVREIFWQSVLGTFSLRGGLTRRLSKAVVSTLLLPHSIWELRCRLAKAKEMTRQYPRIEVMVGNR